MFSCSVAFDSATSWTIAHQTPLSMGFSRQECWSGLPFPPPGDLLYPGIEPVYSVLASGFFTTELYGKPWINSGLIQKKKERKKINHSGDSREWMKRKEKLKRWILDESWNLNSPGIVKSCCWITRIHRDSWPPEEKNSIRGQRRGLIAQSFCVIKFY